MDNLQSPYTEYSSKINYLDHAVRSAQNKKVGRAGVPGAADVLSVSQAEDAVINNPLKVSSEDSIPENHLPQLESVQQFSKKDSAIISRHLMDLVSSRSAVEMKVLVSLGSIFLLSGMIASREQKRATAAAQMAQDFIKPLADLVKEEGLQTAEQTREQAKQMLAQGITGIIGSVVEIGAGIGAMMGTGEAAAQKVSLEEEEDAEGAEESLASKKKTSTASKTGEEELEEESESARSRAPQKATEEEDLEEEKTLERKKAEKADSEEEEKREEVSDRDREEAESALDNSSFKKIAKRKTKEFLSSVKVKTGGFGRTMLRLLGANNAVFGMALSRIITSSGKIYESAVQQNIAGIQTQQAEVRSSKQAVQMYSDMLAQNQSRVQQGAKNLEDMRDGVGQTIREFNQANVQSSRTLFG